MDGQVQPAGHWQCPLACPATERALGLRFWAPFVCYLGGIVDCRLSFLHHTGICAAPSHWAADALDSNFLQVESMPT